MLLIFVILSLFVLNFHILNTNFFINYNRSYNVILFASNFFILFILISISIFDLIGIETLYYLRDDFLFTQYIWETDKQRTLIFVLLSLFFFNMSYFIFAKGLSKIKTYKINDIRLNDKYLIFFIFLFLLLFYLKFLNLEIDSVFTYKKILNNHISNLFFNIVSIIIMRDLLIKKRFLLFIAFASMTILLIGYLTQSRISIILFIVFLIYGLIKLKEIKGTTLKFNRNIFIFSLLAILSIILWVYFMSTARDTLNTDDLFKYKTLGVMQSFLSIILRFEFAYQLENLFQNFHNHFYFNDFNYFIHQLIPNFIDNNNLEFRDFVLYEIDRSIYGDYVYTNLAQIITTTTTYNPILDAYARFGWHSYIYFIFFSLCICSFIFIYSIDKTNVFILLNFYNLMIFDKSIYYMIQQNCYYIFILLIIIFFYLIYERSLS